ncbi:aminotransferase class I/II-fold pyridoxal phosphate-dependent enzyme [Saccharicrinis sp. FJH54]|uniref:aminotransferase class I/II-fold pyridoxal phosphate-dependent enzyme n=1 Tax=Saccharicrinis sp. FJH54 TaxID=3344665 RepID=UPI0035D44625
MKSFTTRSLNVDYPKEEPYNALQMPVYNAVAFEFDTSEDIAANFQGKLPAHAYSRTGNPTTEYLELKLKTLTNSHQAIAMASGMAAISTTIFTLCAAGDNIISGSNLFGHTYAFFNQTIKSFGIENRIANLKSASDILSKLDAKTRLIYLESVTNPQLEIPDFMMISKVARENGIILIVDSTLTPPNVFSSLDHGVDVEVMSTTKYISGGATSVGGVVIDNGTFNWNKNPNLKDYAEKFGQNAFAAKLRKNIFRNMGPCMSPQTAHYQIQGLDILELRLERCFENCLKIGDFLEANPGIKRVDYPGLKSSEYYVLAQKYFNGVPGTIMTFDLGSEEECFRFMNKLKIIRRATNLNDNKSLIIHPWSTIYCEFPDEKRQDMGIRPTMMRLSVGIESSADLIEDIRQALS